MKYETTPRAEDSKLHRRTVLRGAALLGGAAFLPTILSRSALARNGGAGNQVLVYLFLRGGIDPLSTCVPYGDADLYVARPNLAIGPPGSMGGAIDLDGFFGLNPAAAALLPAYHAGDLAVVQAFGSPDPTRSHFLAFQKMEFGVPNQPITGATQGWLARHLALATPASASPLRCAVMHEVMPLSLAGAPRTLPVADPTTFAFPGQAATADAREAILRSMYQGISPPLGPVAADTLDTLELLASQSFSGPQFGAAYPDTELGARLKNAAALIKLDLGVEAIMIEENGYDHHSKQGPKDGELAMMLDDLAQSLAAFRLDLSSHWQRITLVAHSEFGRRVAENASLGTDHGHGGVALVMGGHVNGGRVFGNWPGLAPAQLDDGDLAITVDYRDVLGEILAKRMGATQLSVVFPNHTVSFPGIVN